MGDLSSEDYRLNPLLDLDKYISIVRAGLDYIRPIVERRCDGDAKASAKDLNIVYKKLANDALMMRKLIGNNGNLTESNRVKIMNVKGVLKGLISDIEGQISNVGSTIYDLEYKAAHSS